MTLPHDPDGGHLSSEFAERYTRKKVLYVFRVCLGKCLALGMSLRAEEGKGRNTDVYTSSVDSVDVVRVSEDGPTPGGGGTMPGREREGNDSSSQSPREVNKGSSRQPSTRSDDDRLATELELHVSSRPSFLSSDSFPDSDTNYRKKVQSSLAKKLSSQSSLSSQRKTKSRQCAHSLQANTQGQDFQNLQALLGLAQQLQTGKWICHWLMCLMATLVGKTVLVVSENVFWGRTLLIVSDSGSSDPFADKKKKKMAKLDSDQEAYVGKVFRTWLPGKEADKSLKKCYSLKEGLLYTELKISGCSISWISR